MVVVQLPLILHYQLSMQAYSNLTLSYLIRASALHWSDVLEDASTLISSLSLVSEEMLMTQAWGFDCKPLLASSDTVSSSLSLSSLYQYTSVYKVHHSFFQLQLHFALHHTYMSDIHVQHIHTSQCRCNPLPIHYKNAAHTSPRQWYCLDNQLYPSLASYPDPPSTFQEEKYGEYITTFLYLQGILVAQSDWLIWQLSHLYCFFFYYKPFNEAQQVILKA